MSITQKAAPVALLLTLAGCATGPVNSTTSASGLSAGSMRLSARMSSSIFLQPVPPRERWVFVSLHNTSSAQDLHFGAAIRRRLIAKGYHLTDNPGRAHYMLMANVRYVGKAQHGETAAGALAGGFGGAIVGASYGNENGGVAGGLAGLAIGAAIGHFYQHNRYLMVLDIQLEERQRGTYTSNDTVTSEGLGNRTETYRAAIKGWALYRDRIVAQAAGTNLRFSAAEPALTHEVAGELAGLF